MKRKNSCVSPTEECFDSFMAKTQNEETLQDDNTGGDKQTSNLTETKEVKLTETKEAKPTESDKDSDYGGSECESGEATTFRMLFEKMQVVEVEQFQTSDGRWAVGGVEISNPKMAFLRLLPEDWSRDDVVSILADNAAEGTTLRFPPLSTLITMIGEDGIDYLQSVWGLRVLGEDVENGAPSEGTPPSAASLWSEFCQYREARHLESYRGGVPPPGTLANREDDPVPSPETTLESNTDEEAELMEFLFRKRMDSSKDPFLFFMAVVAALHPPL